MNMVRKSIVIAGAIVSLIQASAADWPQWRGPLLNGSSPDEKGLPETWSKTENVLWKTPLPGPSGATPVISGDLVFVSSPDAEKNLNLLAIDRKTGEVRWKKMVAT